MTAWGPRQPNYAQKTPDPKPLPSLVYVACCPRCGRATFAANLDDVGALYDASCTVCPGDVAPTVLRCRVLGQVSR